MRKAVEHIFDGDTVAYTAYDSSKTNLGKHIRQDSDKKCVGPLPVSLARVVEETGAIQATYPHVVQRTSDLFWVFLAEFSAAAATRRVVLYTYKKSTNVFSYRGHILLTYPPNTNHTIRGLRCVVHSRIDGTVAVSGTAVTGTSTTWTTNRYAAGARIGFGTTDPEAVTTWYHVSAIANDTGITLVEDAGSIPGGTAYVLEEIRVYTTTTNATAANGGLFVAKGVNYDDFLPVGTTISAATGTDNLKAVYWLADAASVLNQAAGGCALEDGGTDLTQIIYVINADASTTARIYKYDGRVALAGLASGKSTSAYLFRTGQQTTAGTLSQTNNGRVATIGHGSGVGVACLYFVSTTRVYRAPLSAITLSSTSFISDCMDNIPTGGVGTFVASATLTQIEYAGSIDRFLVTSSTGAIRCHMTQYGVSGSYRYDIPLFCQTNQLDQLAASSDITPHPVINLLGYSVWVEDGIAFLVRMSTAATADIMYAFPVSCDWNFAVGTSAATQGRVITPALSTPNATQFYRLGVNHARVMGSDNLGLQPEPFRVYARTAGIANDSGEWILLSDQGLLTGLGPSSEIQFMFEFKTLGTFCIPNQIYGLTCTYEEPSTDEHYQPSVTTSNGRRNQFSWRFSTGFGVTVPTLKIYIFDAIKDKLLLEDTTVASNYGLFQKSTDGGATWGAYNTTDKANETTYIRYTPTGFMTNIKVRAILTQ